jgi:hypothetical protein
LNIFSKITLAVFFMIQSLIISGTSQDVARGIPAG